VKKSISRSFDSHLSAYMDALIATTRLNEQGKVAIDISNSFLQNLPHYWMIRQDNSILAASPALADWKPSPFDREIQLYDTSITAIEKTLIFPGNQQVTYLFGMQSDIAKAYMANEIRFFIHMIVITLVILALFLIIIAIAQIQLSTAPIAQLKDQLRAIKKGKNKKLKGRYPTEIRLLTHEINRLIRSRNQTIDRYRRYSADLSHSLKTPLTLLINAANKSRTKLAAQVKTESGLMLDIINRNLTRARSSGQVDMLGEAVAIAPLLDRILLNFAKMYQQSYQLNCAKNITFKGDQHDFFEMIANVIENAFKYGVSTVHVLVEEKEALLYITVEDDGSAISAKEQKAILKRGTRLDESKTGTGIGLGITQEILALYQGSLTIEESNLGGLKAKITLPQL